MKSESRLGVPPAAASASEWSLIPGFMGDLCARIAATRDGGAWRQKPAFDAALTSLAARCLWLEGAMEPFRAEQAVAALRRRGAVPSWLTQLLTEAEVTGWLSQPEHRDARWEAQLLWGVRAGFAASRTPAQPRPRRPNCWPKCTNR